MRTGLGVPQGRKHGLSVTHITTVKANINETVIASNTLKAQEIFKNNLLSHIARNNASDYKVTVEIHDIDHLQQQMNQVSHPLKAII